MGKVYCLAHVLFAVEGLTFTIDEIMTFIDIGRGGPIIWFCIFEVQYIITF